MIDRKKITAEISAALAGDGFLVGVGKAPKDGGWTGGQPGVGDYRPYVTVVWAGAVPFGSQTIEGYAVDWQCNFTIRTFAAAHDQLLDVCSAWGEQLEAFVKSGALVGTASQQYRTLGLRWLNLGPANRDDRKSPAHWSEQDSVGLLVGKTS